MFPRSIPLYCDPPYRDRDGVHSFVAYGAAGFGFDRQSELADLARKLAAKGTPVIILNHDCATAREFYAGTTISFSKDGRSISAAADKRGDIGEVLAISS